MPAPLIVVVEDEVLLALDLAHSLKAKGYRVATYASADDAIEKVTEACRAGDAPLVAVIDVMLRGRPAGLEVARRIREICGSKLILVFTTGWVAEDVLPQASACAPAAVLQKPVDLEELLATLERSLADQNGVELAPKQLRDSYARRAAP